MTEHVGRHASDDVSKTLILPALSGLDEPEVSLPPPGGRGRHASGRTTRDAARPRDAGRTSDSDRPRDAGRPGNGDRLHEGEPLSAADWPSDADWPTDAGSPAGGADQGWAAAAPAERSGPDTPAGSQRAGRQAAFSRRGGPVKLVWVYPDLLSTYGDRGNLLVLTRRAELRDIHVDAIEVKSDEPVPENGDIYLLGGGEDLPQILAARRLRADGGLPRAAERGAVVFAVCAGYQLIGRQFGGVEGETVEGLGILDVTSGRGERRGVGELVADVDPALGVPRLTGFENHQGVTHIGPGARPLARTSLGVGNGDGTEGAYAGNVLGTYLHGPALARNPGLADLLLSWVVGPLQPLQPESEDWARQLRNERLAATGS